MRDFSQIRSSDNKKDRESRARNDLERGRETIPASGSIEPTERDPLLVKSGSVKRRHQSPTFKSEANSSMRTDHSDTFYRGNDPPAHQTLYIPPLPGRDQNVLDGSTDSSEINYEDNQAAHGEIPRQMIEKQQFDDDFRQQYYNERAARLLGEDIPSEDGYSSSAMEVPEEIYTVRKAALTVMEPLIYSALNFSIGVSLTIALGLSRTTALLPNMQYWIIFLPSWLSHLAMLLSYIKAARALSAFISAANENRQRVDSTDHMDRAEYLPLLQRALKFGLKAGFLSFFLFIFEILYYIRLSVGSKSISLAVTFIPLWIIIGSGILDAIICKSQSPLRLISWFLLLSGMILIVSKVDSLDESLQWRTVFTPIEVLLIITSVSLIYIVYGHQIGYYRLTESQLTAGILYTSSSIVSFILVLVFGEILTSNRPMELPIRLFVTLLTPLVVSLVGLGAWAVCRDEFNRLLIHGGQIAVYPKKLVLEANGWTSVEGKGVDIIPLFGEVSFEPLDVSRSQSIELCACCAIYPLDDEDDSAVQYENRTMNAHPGLSITRSASNYGQGHEYLGS